MSHPNKEEWPHDEIRKGPGYKWRMKTSYLINTGYTIDNLNSKSKSEAKGLFEKLFVDIRDELSTLSSYCLDNEEERLQACHNLARLLSKNFANYKTK